MKEIKQAYKEGKVLLFVGAGVSVNLGLPTWSQLIEELANQLDFNPTIFGTYGNFMELAEYYKLEYGKLGNLRSWMDTKWHDPQINVKSSSIHELIVKGNFPLIYTTNYDRWLEKAHEAYGKKFIKIASVGDLTKNFQKDREIIKFHGDFDDDYSLVLNESSYYERLHFQTPLDIKLRSDVLGRSVIFIGYSLSDPNIRHLFYNLNKIWEEYGKGIVKPTSYLFTTKRNPIQSKILKNWGIESIESEIDDSQKALEKFLTDLVN